MAAGNCKVTLTGSYLHAVDTPERPISPCRQNISHSQVATRMAHCSHSLSTKCAACIYERASPTTPSYVRAIRTGVSRPKRSLSAARLYACTPKKRPHPMWASLFPRPGTDRTDGAQTTAVIPLPPPVSHEQQPRSVCSVEVYIVSGSASATAAVNGTAGWLAAVIPGWCNCCNAMPGSEGRSGACAIARSRQASHGTGRRRRWIGDLDLALARRPAATPRVMVRRWTVVDGGGGGFNDITRDDRTRPCLVSVPRCVRLVWSVRAHLSAGLWPIHPLAVLYVSSGPWLRLASDDACCCVQRTDRLALLLSTGCPVSGVWTHCCCQSTSCKNHSPSDPGPGVVAKDQVIICVCLSAVPGANAMVAAGAA